jgi:hypothetical protein
MILRFSCVQPLLEYSHSTTGRQYRQGGEQGNGAYFFSVNFSVKLIILAYFLPLDGQKNQAKKTSAKRYFAASRPGAIKTACPEKQARRL